MRPYLGIGALVSVCETPSCFVKWHKWVELSLQGPRLVFDELILASVCLPVSQLIFFEDSAASDFIALVVLFGPVTSLALTNFGDRIKPERHKVLLTCVTLIDMGVFLSVYGHSGTRIAGPHCPKRPY